jgi:hypothetical protein
MSKVPAPFKVITPVMCFLLLFAGQIAPSSAQLSPARDLTGTWVSSASGMYYETDPSDPNTRMTDITAKFAMDITQQGNQIDIALYLSPISYTTDSAYWNEFGIPAVPPVSGEIDFTGTVSSSSFTADYQGTLSEEHLTGSFTTDLITATLTGNVQETDPNGINLMRTGSPTPTATANPSPTPTASSNPTSTPTTSTSPMPTQTSSSNPTLTPTASTSPTATPTSTFNGDLGSVSLVKGSAWFTNTSANTPVSTGKMASGTTVMTGNDAIVGFNYPAQDGTVYLGGNTAAGWVALDSHPAPDSNITGWSISPPNTALPPIWGQDAKDMLIAIPLGVTLEMYLFESAFPPALAVTLIVEGGVFLIHYGTAYIRETRPHIMEVPEGILAGQETEYLVTVSTQATIVQVIDGSVVFTDPYTNSTVTVEANQTLTLPSGQSGFSYQEPFDPSQIDHWWTQTKPNTLSGDFVSFLFVDQPIILISLLVIIIAAVAIFAYRRSTKRGKSAPTPVLTPFLQEQRTDPPATPTPQKMNTVQLHDSSSNLTSVPAFPPKVTNSRQDAYWEQAIFLEKNEKIINSWTGNWEGSGEIAVRATKKSGGKQTQIKKGLLALTNQRFVFLEEHGVFGKSYHQALTLNLTDVNGVSMGGKFNPFVSIAAGKETNVFHLNQVGNGEFEQFRRLIAETSTNRKAEVEAENKKEHVQIVIDFSTLREYMQKGGLVLQKTKCPECGGPIAIPTAGNQTICEHCGSTVLAQDIFEKLKDLI